MICPNCKKQDSKNLWICPNCKKAIEGGVVFVTGISGSAVNEHLEQVMSKAKEHNHRVMVHDIGKIMYEYARDDDPNMQWDWILNAGELTRKMLRNRAFERVANALKSEPNTLHIIDTHLSFRWHVYLTRGIEPHILKGFESYTRCFINLVEDITKVKDRLSKTSWGDRPNLQLLIWREEELFLSDLFKEICGRVNNYVIAVAEPPSEIEKIIWHPEMKKVYLSFPITNILTDDNARKAIENFRDTIREFLVVFYPYASKDFDETYQKPEMKQIQKEVGKATEERDYRFIDQADAVVVYFPRKVASQGVDAEMRYARSTGKPIFLYSPGKLGESPFAVQPDFPNDNPEEFLHLLRENLS